MILYTEGGTELQNADAHSIMEVLTAAYPGHPWAVRVDGGICFIRYLDVELKGTWGMALKMGAMQHDWAVLKRDVIRAAGEWLERSGLGRGASNGDEIVSVEGVPLRYTMQPLEAEWKTTSIVCDEYSQKDREVPAVATWNDGVMPEIRTTPHRGN